MKTFSLERNMMSLLGDFYPTGHLFLMFPNEELARHAETLLVRDGYDCGAVSLLTPQDIQEKVAHCFEGRDLKLPSVGMEEDTVRHFCELAAKGHYGMLVPARNDKACDRVMSVLKDAGISCAVRYRHLIIEELIE
jgi:hypothetical protein